MGRHEPGYTLQKYVTLMTLFVVLPLAGSALAEDGNAGEGEILAAACASCHGVQGRATGAIPPLAGQDSAELEEKLNRYAAGEPATAVMSRIAPSYTTEERAALAAYFAGLDP